MARSHRLRQPPWVSARASDHWVRAMPVQANGSGGNGTGFVRTISRAVRSVRAPASRSSITSAPNRVAPTPSPVNPAA